MRADCAPHCGLKHFIASRTRSATNFLPANSPHTAGKRHTSKFGNPQVADLCVNFEAGWSSGSNLIISLNSGLRYPLPLI